MEKGHHLVKQFYKHWIRVPESTVRKPKVVETQAKFQILVVENGKKASSRKFIWMKMAMYAKLWFT